MPEIPSRPTGNLPTSSPLPQTESRPSQSAASSPDVDFPGLSEYQQLKARFASLVNRANRILGDTPSQPSEPTDLAA